MKALTATLIALAALVLLAPTAGATPAHWTDGTAHDGKVNWGPPPHPATVVSCTDITIDPPTYVFVTVHVFYGPAPTTAPVVGDASAVYPYVGSAPGTFHVDPGSMLVGHSGNIVETWNLGTGVSQATPFDCAPPESTTTLAPTTTTTTVAPTTTTAPATTTTNPCDQFARGIAPGDPRPGASQCGPTTSTTSKPSSTTSVEIGTPATATLPFTGGSSGSLAAVGLAAIVAGAALAFARRRAS